MSQARNLIGLSLATAAALCLALSEPAASQSDVFTRHVYPGVSAPADNFAVVTPSDATNFTYLPRGIYVGGAGNVVAIDSDGTAVTFTGVAAGSVLPIRPKRINSTNTTATSLVAIW